MEAQANGEALGVEPEVIDAYQQVLEDDELDHALSAEALTLPLKPTLQKRWKMLTPMQFMKSVSSCGKALRKVCVYLWKTYKTIHTGLKEQGAYSPDAVSIGKRRLQNTCLSYLGQISDPGIHGELYQQFSDSENMTDALSALGTLSNIDCPQRDLAFDDFEAKWQHDTLVMDKWFVMQATSSLPNTLDKVKELMNHKLFDMKNPNKVRALIGAFANGNPVNFHKADGSGYEFHADRVLELDKLNPQVASRMVRALMNWRHYEAGRSELMRGQLERIKAVEGLSGDVFEIVSKSLAA